MIECFLQPLKLKYSKNQDGKQKHGMYMQTMYWSIKGYGKKTWLVTVNIDLDYDKAKELYESDDEIIEKCIEYLNTPPKSKYGKRRKRKPLYTFDIKPYSYKIIENESGKKIISARLTTKEQKNKYFWKSGPSI